MILETMSYGRMYLAISIANVTYPRTVFSTHYSTVLSIVNETLQASYVRGFGLRVESITIQDNYDGSASSWGNDNNLTDASQVDSVFNFHTSTIHEMRFTISYQLYDLFVFGYVVDHSSTRSYNVTQSVL